MRKTFLMLAIAGLVAGPTFADIGTVTMDIKVSDDGGLTFVDSLSYDLNVDTVPSSLLVAVSAGATASGVDGSNNGVQGLYFDLVGDALGTVTQSALTVKVAFRKAWSPNMGFDKFTSGGTFDTVNGGLVGIGGAQAAPPGPLPDDMAGAFTPNAAGIKGLPFASVIVDGSLALASLGIGSYAISTDASATMWEMAGTAATAGMVNDTVLITVTPEPVTLLMLAPGLLLAMRRRRR